MMTKSNKNKPIDENKLIQEKIEQLLQRKNDESAMPFKMSMEELANEISVYHQELIYQNEELLRQKQQVEDTTKIYQDLFDKAPIAYVVLDENYKIRSANKTFAEIMNTDIYSLKQKTLTDLIHPESQDAFYQTMRKLDRKGQSQLEELRMGEFWFSFRSNHFYRDENRMIRCALVDITQKKLAEEKLEENNQRFNLALKGANVGVWDWDLKENTVFYSSEFKRILGYREVEFENKIESWKSAWHPEDKETIEKTLKNHLENKLDKYELAHRLMHKDGDYRWILLRGFVQKDENDDPSRFIGTILDITDLTKEEQYRKELEEKNRMIESILGSSPIAIWMSGETPASIFTNTFFKENFDLTEEEMKVCQQTNQETLKANQTKRYIEKVTFKDGKKHTLEIVKTPLKIGVNGTMGVLGLAVDVTQRLETETVLRNREALFNTTLTSVKEGIVLTSLHGEIILFNSAAERITGRSKEEVVHSNVSDVLELIYAESGESAYEHIRKVLKAGGQFDAVTDFSLIDKNGTPQRLLLSIGLVEADAGEDARIIASFQDVSREYELEKQMQGFLDVNIDMLCVGDLKGNLLKVNKKFEEVLGYNTDDVFNQKHTSYVHPDDLEMTLEALARIENQLSIGSFVNRFRSKDGEYKYIEWNSIPFAGKYVYSSARDVTEQRRMQAELRESAIKDELTGLYNRNYFESIINEQMLYSDRYDEPFSLVLIDLDQFKQVNDTWGHPIGDELLKHTARNIRQVIRESDILVRFGGEEFAVLMPRTLQSGAMYVAEKIRESIEKNTLAIIGKRTASLGVAERMKAESFRHLYSRLDASLYNSKNRGRNQVSSLDFDDRLPIEVLELEWRLEMLSGNHDIDKQHQQIFDLSNQLIRLSFDKKNQAATKRKIEQLINYLSAHYEEEERILAQVNYPELKQHIQIHRDQSSKIKRLKESYELGDIKPIAFVSFLVDEIILNHTTRDDRRFFVYLK